MTRICNLTPNVSDTFADRVGFNPLSFPSHSSLEQLCFQFIVIARMRTMLKSYFLFFQLHSNVDLICHFTLKINNYKTVSHHHVSNFNTHYVTLRLPNGIDAPTWTIAKQSFPKSAWTCVECKWIRNDIISSFSRIGLLHAIVPLLLVDNLTSSRSPGWLFIG